MSVRVEIDPSMTNPFMVKRRDDGVTYLLRPDLPLQAAAWLISLAEIDPTAAQETWVQVPIAG